MPFLPPNQQHQSTEGKTAEGTEYQYYHMYQKFAVTSIFGPVRVFGKTIPLYL